MRLRCSSQAEPRGLAFPLALMALMLLATLALALLSMSSVEPLISRNLVDSAQARFAAEAGIEWAFNTLRASLDWDSFLAGATPNRGAVLIADSPIPGQPPSAGTYTVRVRNDSLAGDQLITGLPEDSGGPADDTNSVLILTSIGSAGRGSRTLQAVLRRIELPPVPAALAFPGNKATVSLSGSFEIDGHDWTPDGASGPCAPIFGITVSSVLPASAPGANEAAVESALGQSLANVRGKGQDPTGPASGANTIAPDAVLTPSQLQSFVSAARKADIVLEGGELSFNDLGADCAANWSSAACWGTADRPKVVYVKGNPDPTSAISRLQISGSSGGHGVLIVEDGELSISGNFYWYGAIIVTGSRIGVSFPGGGSQTVYGGVIFNDAASDPGPGKGLLISGNTRLRYSCRALEQARLARKLVVLKSWREITQ